MQKINFEIEIKNQNFSEVELSNYEFDRCTFLNCNFSENNLRMTEFIDCLFDNCNFSSVKFNNTSLKNVDFVDSKMIGVDFSNVNEFLFAVNFKNCQLDFSYFYRLNLKKTQFLNCSLKELDFSESNLSESLFQNCDLSQSVFDKTNLCKADLASAQHYQIDPTNNNIKKAKFTYPALLGLISKFDIIIK